MAEGQQNIQQRKDRQALISSENIIHSTRDNSSSSESTRVQRSNEEEKEDYSARIFRRQTQIASVPLSYFDLFKAFIFGIKGLKQNLAAKMETRNLGIPEEKMYDDKDCEYILTVTVFPKEPTEDFRQRAKCVLDTACLQGNIISRRLADSLGFDQREYEQITEREKQGGTVATGHKHYVHGAIRVSWSYGTGTEIIRHMRFLVSENEHLDMIVGARSIRKWNLISPPNFITAMEEEETDPERENISGEIAQLDNLIKAKERRQSELKGKLNENDPKMRAASEEIATLRNKQGEVEFRLGKYDQNKEAKKKLEQESQKESSNILGGLFRSKKSTGNKKSSSSGT